MITNGTNSNKTLGTFNIVRSHWESLTLKACISDSNWEHPAPTLTIKGNIVIK